MKKATFSLIVSSFFTFLYSIFNDFLNGLKYEFEKVNS